MNGFTYLYNSINVKTNPRSTPIIMNLCPVRKALTASTIFVIAGSEAFCCSNSVTNDGITYTKINYFMYLKKGLFD